MNADLLARKTDRFVLWRPSNTNPPPRLVIGQLQRGSPVSLVNERQFPLRQAAGIADLWEIPAAECGLAEGEVYHYWFEVGDSHPDRPAGTRIRVTDPTDPTAFAVDWRPFAPRPAGPAYGEDDRYPASVIKYLAGRLVPCDPGGETGDLQGDQVLAALPLTTAWSSTNCLRPERRLTAGRTTRRRVPSVRGGLVGRLPRAVAVD